MAQMHAAGQVSHSHAASADAAVYMYYQACQASNEGVLLHCCYVRQLYKRYLKHAGAMIQSVTARAAHGLH